MSLPKLQTKSFNVETKADDESPDGACCVFEGIVACFLNIDADQDIFVPGCFSADIDFFRAEGVVRDEHCVTTGRIDAADETAGGLRIKATILDTAAGRDQATLLRGGAVKRLSIGSRNWGRWTSDPNEVKTLWQAHGYEPTEDDLTRLGFGVRLITRSKPYEASTTWIPANAQTRITDVKSAGSPPHRTFDAHATEVLEALEDLASRAAAIAALRASNARGLSPKSAARLRAVGEKIARLQTPDDSDQGLYDQHLAREARYIGRL